MSAGGTFKILDTPALHLFITLEEGRELGREMLTDGATCRANEVRMMKTPPAVAVVCPDESFLDEIAVALGERATLIACTSLSELTTILGPTPPDDLVLDARSITDGGKSLGRFLNEVGQRYGNVSTIILTGENCPEVLSRRIACAGIRRLSNIENAAELVESLTAAVSSADPVAENDSVGKSVDARDAEFVQRDVTRRFETLSHHLQSMLEELSVAAEHDVTILLVGETGSGKTYLSRLIHDASPRRAEPFLHVACGALPRELIESELFGHAKGSFTSAHADKAGKFVAADRGTILLDEIDVLEPEQQVKLLRVIETGEFEPVGSNETLTSRARLVVASNRDLQPLVEEGRFRPDLFYRLNMLRFEIPPLRQRRMDIVPLAKHFIRKYQQKHEIAIGRIEDSLLEALTGYPWPGNVRELENVVQRAVIYCRDGTLSARQLPHHILTGTPGPIGSPQIHRQAGACTRDQSLSRLVARTEKEIIEQALLENNYSKTKTAQSLGISRVTLYNKLKKHEVSL